MKNTKSILLLLAVVMTCIFTETRADYCRNGRCYDRNGNFIGNTVRGTGEFVGDTVEGAGDVVGGAVEGTGNFIGGIFGGRERRRDRREDREDRRRQRENEKERVYRNE